MDYKKYFDRKYGEIYEGNDAAYIASKIGANILDLRLKVGISQAELAEMVGTKQPAIARLERGDVLPRIDFLLKIASALRVQVAIPFLFDTRKKLVSR